MEELVSIIIPVFNRGHLIGETLNSVLAQTWKNWECIVIDDGSEDETVQVVKDFSTKDSRFKLLKRPSNKRKGANSCRNVGLKSAQGRYIQFLDSDDLIKENKLEAQLKLLEKSSPLSLVTCRWGSFTTSSRLNVKTKWHSYRHFKNSLKLLEVFGRYNEYLPAMVYLLPKSLCEKSGAWKEDLVNNQDGEYFSRVLLNAKGVVFCGATEAYYRAGEKKRTSVLDDEEKIRSAIESWKIIQRNLKEHRKICRIYSRNGIRNVYNKIKDSHPKIIEEYSDFFKENLRNEKWYNKLWGINITINKLKF